MQGSGWKLRLNKGATYFELLGIVCFQINFWLFLEIVDQAAFPGMPLWLVKHINGYQALQMLWFTVPMWGMIAGLVIWLLGFCGQRVRSAKDWRVIQFILDKAQEIAYGEHIGDGPMHHHRVTLFRHDSYARVDHWSKRLRPRWARISGWLWPWGSRGPFSGWLVPVARSGNNSKDKKSIFLARCAGDTEGICGSVWDDDKTKVVRKLPKVCPSNKHNRETYANSTNCPVQMIHHMMVDKGKQKIAPRSIGGVPIRVDGKRWGALVFDSQAPDGVKETVESDFQIAVGVIEKLLEK